MKYKSIVNLSEPVAAASVAQVHKAQINDDGIIKDVAIKILSEGRAILLKRLPVLIINANLSLIDNDIFFKSGAKTAPRKIEPPTQIDALRR